jgi:hypothetical protein
VGKRVGTPEGASVVIDVTGDVQRHVVCMVTCGRAAVVAEEPTSPLAHITMDVETFVVLATGRRTADQMGSRLTYSGDAEHGRRVTSALNMMI